MRFFFFQAEDGIRDKLVTGVQTCALLVEPSEAFGRLAVEAHLDGYTALDDGFEVERDAARRYLRDVDAFGQVHLDVLVGETRDAVAGLEVGDVCARDEIARVQVGELALAAFQSHVNLFDGVVADLHVLREDEVELHAAQAHGGGRALRRYGVPEAERDDEREQYQLPVVNDEPARPLPRRDARAPVFFRSLKSHSPEVRGQRSEVS